ncbi:hypothetical protein KDL01_14990 [Actinospica durhamensis]|uniref:Uncharacterized protein n=1 Tax=Actinospica durhamensis TaxID=1508375 RepID=A0A941EP78_9ACTN|nr:hypothetical protein [Actinospica durhamensis]MBR7834578.1 hypothetical protein [Actinospica durhamensis]
MGMLSRGKKDQSLVRLPRGKVGRMVFAGGQVAAAAAAWRAVKDAKAKGDRLAVLHGALTGAVVLLTLAVALRTVHEEEQTVEGEIVDPSTP